MINLTSAAVETNYQLCFVKMSQEKSANDHTFVVLPPNQDFQTKKSCSDLHQEVDQLQSHKTVGLQIPTLLQHHPVTLLALFWRMLKEHQAST